MRKIMLLILAGIMLAGCQVTKQIDKQRNRDRSERVTNTDSTAHVDLTEQTDIRTVEDISTTERINVMVTMPGAFITTGIAQNNLNQGTYTETAEMTLRIFRDSLTGVIMAQATTKPKEVPVTGTRTRKENRIIIDNSIKDQETDIHMQKDGKEKKDVQSETNKKVVKRPYWMIWVGLTVAVVVALVLFALYRYFKK